MHEVLVNPLGGLSLPRKSVVRLTDCPDMTLDVYHGRKPTTQQKQQHISPDRFYPRHAILLEQVQWTFSGSNTDGLFTTAISNSFLNHLKKNPIAADLG